MGDERFRRVPAGWYDDGNGVQRYWDGARWTELTAAAPLPESEEDRTAEAS